MTAFEEENKILKDFIIESVEKMEKGHVVYVTGGYIQHDYKARVLDANCSKIVTKLSSLGYSYTTNHGHGCKDYRFIKNIEL